MPFKMLDRCLVLNPGWHRISNERTRKGKRVTKDFQIGFRNTVYITDEWLMSAIFLNERLLESLLKTKGCVFKTMLSQMLEKFQDEMFSQNRTNVL